MTQWSVEALSRKPLAQRIADGVAGLERVCADVHLVSQIGRRSGSPGFAAQWLDG